MSHKTFNSCLNSQCLWFLPCEMGMTLEHTSQGCSEDEIMSLWPLEEVPASELSQFDLMKIVGAVHAEGATCCWSSCLWEGPYSWSGERRRGPRARHPEWPVASDMAEAYHWHTQNSHHTTNSLITTYWAFWSALLCMLRSLHVQYLLHSTSPKFTPCSSLSSNVNSTLKSYLPSHSPSFSVIRKLTTSFHFWS